MAHRPVHDSNRARFLGRRLWMYLSVVLLLALAGAGEARTVRKRSTAKAQPTQTPAPKKAASKPDSAAQDNEKPAARKGRSSSRKPAAAPHPENLGLHDWEESSDHAEDAGRERWTVHVEDLRTTRTIFDFHPDDKLSPASNRKLITMALALETLGPGYVFHTVLGLTAPHTPGSAHYHGDLVLRAAGDPSLGFPFEHQTIENPRDVFVSWARDLKRRGIAYIHGDLVVDGTAFGADQNHYPENWGPSNHNQTYAPIPSAIALCQNLLRVQVRPGSEGGRSGRLVFYPGDQGLSIVNDTRTSSHDSGVGAAFNADGDLVVSGRVDEDGGDEVLVPLIHPLNYAGALMQDAVEDQGIRLLGNVRVQTSRQTLGSSATLQEMIGDHASPPLARLLTVMMRNSNNFLAEEIWRAAGARTMSIGDLARARIWEKAWFDNQGLKDAEAGWDGCGLSHDDKFSARTLAAVARRLYRSAYRDFVLEALPESGVTGTLRNRNFDRGAGRVIAKTGTLNDVSALTGFICDKGGQPRYVFSVVGNGRTDSSSHLAGQINVLVEELLKRVDAEAD